MTMPTNSVLLRAVLFLSCLVLRTSALCDLCDGGVASLLWPRHQLDDGSTCVLKAIELAKIESPNSNACTSAVGDYRTACCTNDPIAPPGEAPPTKPPTYNGPVGIYDQCDLCKDGDYPYATSMVINMLYIGVGSCKQYYDYANNGLIQNHLCSALQFFAYEPCGCGEFNPKFNPNHPLNQQASQAPVRPTGPGGTPNPTNKPTLPPTDKPTQAPVSTPRPTSPPTPRPTPSPTPQPTARPTQKPNNSDGNGNNDSSTNDSRNNIAVQKAPNNDGKANTKLGNTRNRGGRGGQRYLKGARKD